MFAPPLAAHHRPLCIASLDVCDVSVSSLTCTVIYRYSKRHYQLLTPRTQAIHRIFTQFAVEKSLGQGLVVAYAEYFVSLLAEYGSSPTMQDLLELHEKLLLGIRLGSDGKEEAFDMLKGKEHEDQQYGKALRFAVDKGLAPGLSFLNGRIFDDEKAFTDEQR